MPGRPVLTRRAALGLSAVPLLPGRAVAAEGLDRAEWEAFRARFMRPDGRVVDTLNGGVSHSEGQGWALLCAVRAGDRDGFDLALHWTRRVLARPGDALHAWRYRPEGGGAVDDPNNASDGDLMIAWALLQAAERWGGRDYAALGAAVARDVLRLLVREVDGEAVLLPGAAGFESRQAVVLNPSYYAFPAFRALARAVPDPLWLRLSADGLAFLRRARFGRWGLPPDWVALPRGGGRPAPAPGWPPRFSYDALRVPLYLVWAGLGREPAVAAAARFWSDPRHGRLPAWVDLTTGTIAPYPAPPGVRAVARLAAMRQDAPAPAAMPRISETRDYYSAVVTLLSRIAWHDASRRMV